MQTQKEQKNQKPGWMSLFLNNTEMDLVDMILEDHKPLKELIKILKDGDRSLSERQKAYDEFSILLASHAKPEESSLYIVMKAISELRAEAFEGDVEHGIADKLMAEIARTSDKDLWTARVKVLAESVEHHIQEEEETTLPDYKKYSDKEERIAVGRVFLKLKTDILENGGKAPSARKH